MSAQPFLHTLHAVDPATANDAAIQTTSRPFCMAIVYPGHQDATTRGPITST